MQLLAIITIVFSGLPNSVFAHPGHNVKDEAAQREAYLNSVPVQSRSLAHCTSIIKKRGIENVNAVRRKATVDLLRRKRGISTGTLQGLPLFIKRSVDKMYLKARDFNSTLATNHHSSLTGVDVSTDPHILFGSGGTCIVQPEVTQGPYYIAGELIRENVIEDQEGVPLFMDIQLIDINTCDPMPHIYTDMWHCNATGVYSGVVANGNGNINDSSNLNTTFLRGVQESRDDGVVRFETIFPGHYTYRAVHIHVATHPVNETKILPNGTIAGIYDGRSSHVGQIFFDQDLITAVEMNPPYKFNTQVLTENSDDDILGTEAKTTDPFMEYLYLGDSPADGIFAWISIGVNANRDDALSPEGYWTEDGGEVNDNFSMNMTGIGNIGSMPTTSSAVTSSTSLKPR
ncbi:hypothetical protein N7456_009009 [Penicillium angulare]|uniref:Intradiol ring-cleavage dioxygenase, core n=1 Tax=Penicillium angulare TaxID=116970 RepID=A0A9W9K4T3_9EURO|nr:hypothetical protein N7456_009009 [Penicillium angulare]